MVNGACLFVKRPVCGGVPRRGKIDGIARALGEAPQPSDDPEMERRRGPDVLLP